MDNKELLKQEIVKRKQLERESEERRLYLEAVLACAPDAIITLDEQGKVNEWNPGAENLFGYSKEEAIGEDIDSLIASPDPEKFKEASRFTKELLNSKSIPLVETIRYRRDGSPVNVIAAGSPIFIRDKLVGVVAMYTDITQRKQVEQQLKRYTEELKQANEEIKQFAYIVSHDLRAPLVNLKGFSAELRNSIEQLKEAVKPALTSLDENSQQAAAIALEEDIPEALGFIDSSVDGEEGIKKYDTGSFDILILDQVMPVYTGLDIIKILKSRGELPPIIMVTGTGSEQIAVEALKLGASDYIVKDVNGVYLKLLPSVIDQTLIKYHLEQEKLRVEEALRESQRALSTLISNLPGIAYRCRNDRKRTMEFISEGCYELTGYRPEDLVMNAEKSYTDLIHPDDRKMIWEQVQKAIEEHRPFQFQYRIRTADGEEKWVWEQGTGVFSSEGELLRLEGFITDITARILAEHERERLIEELQKALENVKRLRGLLPICASCKKIRDDEGYWHSVEAYMEDHSEAQFTHGICPDCMKKLYPGYEPEEQ
ncbi:MAG: hypothetical protein DRP87_09950 [Spirochaetes bacterium]|nr:MAG: hypothetical protein DRP87_09950 [Spirochaetota bacterium]